MNFNLDDTFHISTSPPNRQITLSSILFTPTYIQKYHAQK